MSLIETLYEELINIGEKPDSIVGCTPSEIEEIKLIQGVTNLPDMYYEFMSKMGQNSGKLFKGTIISYKAMKHFNFKEEAQNFLNDMDVKLKLPETAFVFFWHQGYIFLYFDTQTNEIDPIVYRYE